MPRTNVDELLSAYPTIKQAVAFVELFIDFDVNDEFGSDEDVSSWQLMIEGGCPPSDVVDIIKGVIQDAVDDEDEGRNEEALAQSMLPEFLTYISGKMGAV